MHEDIGCRTTRGPVWSAAAMRHAYRWFARPPAAPVYTVPSVNADMVQISLWVKTHATTCCVLLSIIMSTSCSHVKTTCLSIAQWAIIGRKSIILSVWRYIKGLAVLSHDLADHLSSAVRLTIFWKSPTYFLEMPV